MTQLPLQDWDSVKKFLADRYGIKTTNIETMAKYMATELGFADKSILNNQKKVGAPTKWNITIDGLILFARFELEISDNPGLKKSAIANIVKEKYNYSMSAKRLQNLYTILPLDPFVKLSLEIVRYSQMSKEDKRKFLVAYASKNR